MVSAALWYNSTGAPSSWGAAAAGAGGGDGAAAGVGLVVDVDGVYGISTPSET